MKLGGYDAKKRTHQHPTNLKPRHVFKENLASFVRLRAKTDGLLPFPEICSHHASFFTTHTNYISIVLADKVSRVRLHQLRLRLR